MSHSVLPAAWESQSDSKVHTGSVTWSPVPVWWQQLQCLPLAEPQPPPRVPGDLPAGPDTPATPQTAAAGTASAPTAPPLCPSARISAASTHHETYYSLEWRNHVLHAVKCSYSRYVYWILKIESNLGLFIHTRVIQWRSPMSSSPDQASLCNLTTVLCSLLPSLLI